MLTCVENGMPCFGGWGGGDGGGGGSSGVTAHCLVQSAFKYLHNVIRQ